MGRVADEVEGLSDALGMNGRVRRTALEMAGRTEASAKYDTKGPAGLAAACVYAAGLAENADDPPTQKEAADAAGVAAMTVRNHFGSVLADHHNAQRPKTTRQKVTPADSAASTLELFERYWVEGESMTQMGVSSDRLRGAGVPTRAAEDAARLRDGEASVESMWEDYLTQFQFRLARDLRTMRLNDLREATEA